MESDKNVEKAIRKLMEDHQINAKTTSPCNQSIDDDADDEEKPGGRRRRQLLSKLLTEFESMEEEEEEEEEEEDDDNNNNFSAAEVEVEVEEEEEVSSCSNEEIIKELKNVKRQNTITHCLLTAMIVLTLTWQLSEVSLILKIKHGLSNPFKFIGGLITGFWKSRHPHPQVSYVQDVMSEVHKHVTEPTSLPSLKIPELELPCFDTSDKDKDD